MATQYNPKKHHRRSIRLTGYDYKQSGAYFVTIVTRNRICLFGDISDGEMVLSDTGRIAEVSWVGLSSRFAVVSLDFFVVMPNHIHGIITVGAQFIAPGAVPHNRTDTAQEGAMNRAPTLGEIIRTYKAASTRMIRQTANLEFAWQRNYYEHVVRNEESLNRIRQYILENPARWAMDRENRTLLIPNLKILGNRRSRGRDESRPYPFIESEGSGMNIEMIRDALRYGYCRCEEPVNYVAQIQNRYDHYVQIVPMQ